MSDRIKEIEFHVDGFRDEHPPEYIRYSNSSALFARKILEENK